MQSVVLTMDGKRLRPIPQPSPPARDRVTTVTATASRLERVVLGHLLPEHRKDAAYWLTVLLHDPEPGARPEAIDKVDGYIAQAQKARPEWFGEAT